jgi:hypothetical protein
MAIHGDDGFIYQLDIPAQKLQRDDGFTIALTASQTVEAANGFLAVVETDAIDNSFQYVSQPRCYEGPCEVDPLSLPIEGKTIPSGMSHGTKNGRKFQPLLIRKVENLKGNQLPTNTDGVATLSFGPCEDVWNLIREHLNGQRTRRSSWLGGIFGAVIQSYGSNVSGPFGVPIGAAAGYLTESVSELYAKKISLGVLAGYWNGYQCSSQMITTYSNTSSAFGGGGASKTCSIDTFSISFDGGDSWHLVTVQVCIIH